MPPSDPLRLTRRRLLIGGTAAVAAAAIPIELDLTPAAAAGGPPAMSLGYVTGSAGARSLGELAGGHAVVPATSLPTGAASLGAPTRVVVGGLAGPGGLPPGIAAVDFDVVVPLAGGAVAPSHVWSQRPGWTSAPAQFSAGASTWMLTVTPTGAGAAVTTTSTPTSGATRGRPKLVPGIYLAGLGRAWDRRRALPASGDPAWASSPSLVLAVLPSAA